MWSLKLTIIALVCVLGSSAQQTPSLASSSAESFTNPVLWEDLADNDVFRVNDGTYLRWGLMAVRLAAWLKKEHSILLHGLDNALLSGCSYPAVL